MKKNMFMKRTDKNNSIELIRILKRDSCSRFSEFIAYPTKNDNTNKHQKQLLNVNGTNAYNRWDKYGNQ